MLIIPAIDIQAGRCVRLRQGSFQDVTVYGDDPRSIAEAWHRQGAERIHVVDLDGSRSGRPRNGQVVRDIASAVPVPVQVGGGLRDMASVAAYLDAGVQWVILGTSALREEGFVREACRTFPGRVILGLDARKGCVAVQGWAEQTGEKASDVAKRFADAGVAAVIYTDIQRDGMETGVNWEETARLARVVCIPVIASGGVSGPGDIAALLAAGGIAGVVVGRALYTGGLSLPEAIRIAGGGNGGSAHGKREGDA